MFSLQEILPFQHTHRPLIILLRQHDLLLKAGAPCAKCTSPMVLRTDGLVADGQSFLCRNCNERSSIRSRSIFANHHLSLYLLTQLLIFFQAQLTVTQSTTLSDLSHASVSHIYKSLRQRIEEYNEQHPIIYDMDDIIEVDETLIKALKIEATDEEEGREGWVIGLVGRKSHLIHLEMINDRRAETLINIIKQHVPPHTRITTDQHASYGDLMYTHEYAPCFKYHVGSSSFVMTYTEPSARHESWRVHTNTIEGTWALLKSHFHQSHGWPASYIHLVLSQFIYHSRNIPLSVALQPQ